MTRILLAEDEEVLRMLIVDTLEEENYIVDEASDGEEALALLAEQDYDLIILDYMMPGFTGVEVIEKVKSEAGRNHGTTIIMLSAKSQKFDQEKGLAAGADYFISKPFSPFDLLEKVKEIIDETN